MPTREDYKVFNGKLYEHYGTYHAGEAAKIARKVRGDGSLVRRVRRRGTEAGYYDLYFRDRRKRHRK